MANGADTLYFCSSSHNIVARVTSWNAYALVAGDMNRVAYADGFGSSAWFNRPTSIALIGRSLYVLEYQGLRLRKVDLDTQEVTTVSGRCTPNDYFDFEAQANKGPCGNSWSPAVCQAYRRNCDIVRVLTRRRRRAPLPVASLCMRETNHLRLSGCLTLVCRLLSVPPITPNQSTRGYGHADTQFTEDYGSAGLSLTSSQGWLYVANEFMIAAIAPDFSQYRRTRVPGGGATWIMGDPTRSLMCGGE